MPSTSIAQLHDVAVVLAPEHLVGGARARRRPGPSCSASVADRLRRPLTRMIWTLAVAAARRWRMTGSSILPFSRAVSMMRPARSRTAGTRWWPTVPRSKPRVVMATFQPLLTPPTTLSFGQRASVKKTSLNSARSVDLLDGPDLDAVLVHRDTAGRRCPACLRTRRGRCGTSTKHVVGVLGLGGPDLLAVDDPLVAVELGRGCSDGQVAPGVGLGEALAPARSAPLRISGRNSFFCSSVPHCRMVGPTRVSPKKSPRIGALGPGELLVEDHRSASSRGPCRRTPSGHEAQIQPPSNSLAGPVAG